MIFISQAYAQTEDHGEAMAEDHGAMAGDDHGESMAADTHATTEAHGGGEHGAFPPFDPATWGSQLFWLVITFGALFYMMKRVALPRVAAILEQRSSRIAGDLETAGRMKEETDAAIAGYEQALAEARQRGHTIAQKARDDTKAAADADRARIEAELQEKLDAADAQIAAVKSQALAQVDAIARDATEAMVEAIVGGEVGKSEVAAAVEAAMAEGS